MRFIDSHPVMQERGRVRDLARALKVTQSAISQWKRVPADKVHKVAALIGIPADELRPDIFPPREAAE